MKILVVDDSHEMRKVIIELLDETGTEFIEAEDGEDVLKIYHSFKPDWVLMDINMKRMNGFEATKLIKGDFIDAHIAIVSKYDDAYYRNYAKSIGVEAFVSKQNLFELKNVIK